VVHNTVPLSLSEALLAIRISNTEQMVKDYLSFILFQDAIDVHVIIFVIMIASPLFAVFCFLFRLFSGGLEAISFVVLAWIPSV
jgi:hypothetical protein